MIRPSLSKPARLTLALLAGFALAVWMRVLIGGADVAQSAAAGLVFAGCLAAMGLAAGTKFELSRRAAAVGLAGGLALCAPAALANLFGAPHHATAAGFPLWALVVTIVAVAEEYFLRGVLFDASEQWLGVTPAMLITAAAFAALHLPLYGWPALPLDFAVGLWLGALRLAARTWTAPAIAHTLADLISWWLR